MKIKTVALDELTRKTLMASRIDGTRLFLPGQLDRADYQRVAKAIEAAGGRWNRKEGCHVFPADVRQTLNIEQETVTVVNVRQTLQAFDTPPEVARRVAELAGVLSEHRLLEPSAGLGRLVEAVGRSVGVRGFTGETVMVEIDPARYKNLVIQWPTSTVLCGDFLSMGKKELGLFDRVVMNPPFTRGADVQHILHARSLLHPGGRLVAICANGGRQQDELRPLADKWHDISAGAFKASGTNIRTAIVVIEN